MTDTEISQPTAPNRSNSGAWIGVIGIVLGIGGLAAGGLALEQLSRARPLFETQQVQQTRSAKEVADITSRVDGQSSTNREYALAIDALKAEIAGLHEAIAEKPGTDTIAPQAIDDRITALLAARQETEAPITHRIEALEKAQKANEDETNQSVFDDTDIRTLRFVMLQDTIRHGHDYRDALHRFREALGDGIAEHSDVRDAFTTLGKNNKAPALSALYRSFSEIPSGIRQEEESYVPATAPKAGWWGRTEQSLATLVKIEKVDAAVPPHALIQRARSAMESGDVAYAAELIHALPEHDRAAYDDWLNGASLYQSTLTALDVLRAACFIDSESAKD